MIPITQLSVCDLPLCLHSMSYIKHQSIRAEREWKIVAQRSTISL